MDSHNSVDGGATAAATAAEALRGKGADYWDVFLHSLSQSTVRLRSSLRGSQFGPPNSTHRAILTEGIGLRLMRDGLVGFSCTADCSPAGIGHALESPDFKLGSNVSDGVPETTTDRSSSSPDRDLLKQLALELLDLSLAAHDRVTSVDVEVSRIGSRRLVATPGQPELTDERHLVEARVSLAFDGMTIALSKTVHGAEADGNLDLTASFGSRLVSKASRAAADNPTVAGDLPVVFGPGWGAVWLHEAVGHQLEADVFESGQSALSDLMHRRIASENVTVVDNPQVLGGRVIQAFDDEGVESQTTTLIENGRLVGLLTDRIASVRADLPLTGNGRRAHYAQNPRPRMTNLLLLSGDQSAESLIGSVKRGILANDVRHAWYDPDSGLVRLHVVEAKLIERGRITSDLAPIVLSSDPKSLLAGISGVGSDFQVDQDRGYCSKGGANILVGVGQPTVLINSMTATPAEST